jgi:hypothetical protein
MDMILGILPSERYSGIRMFAALSMCINKYQHRPFLSTAKAIICVDSAKICFTIKDRKEKFAFKNRILQSPSHPQMVYQPEKTTVSKKKDNWRRRKNKTRQP